MQCPGTGLLCSSGSPNPFLSVISLTLLRSGCGVLTLAATGTAGLIVGRLLHADEYGHCELKSHGATLHLQVMPQSDVSRVQRAFKRIFAPPVFSRLLIALRWFVRNRTNRPC